MLDKPEKLTITLTSYNPYLLQQGLNNLLNTLRSKTCGYYIISINTPKKKEKHTVLRSPHVYKKSREQFQLAFYTKVVTLELSTISASGSVNLVLNNFSSAHPFIELVVKSLSQTAKFNGIYNV
jgi:small subunit ribosomal protein S10